MVLLVLGGGGRWERVRVLDCILFVCVSGVPFVFTLLAPIAACIYSFFLKFVALHIVFSRGTKSFSFSPGPLENLSPKI